jgi:hypothetical protein
MTERVAYFLNEGGIDRIVQQSRLFMNSLTRRKRMRYFVCPIAVLMVCFSISWAAAQDKVVVIPLNSARQLQNVVTVSPKGGDFTDPIAAVNSITAAADNPYLVLIGPGIYVLTQTLSMKPYVSITGSGQGITILTGAISSDTSADAAIVAGADNATLTNLTVENTGGTGGNTAVAIHNNFSSPMIQNVSATASGALFSAGVLNSFSTSRMDNVTASATGSILNIGVYNVGSGTYMTNVTASAEGGVQNYGVWNAGAPLAIMYNVNADAVNPLAGTTSYGIYNTTASPNLRNCRTDGDTNGIYVDAGSTVRVTQSSILNGFIVEVGGTLTCATSDNGVDLPLDPATCLP